MRKIEVLTESVPEFELGQTVPVSGGRIGRQEKGRKRQRNGVRRRPGGRRQERSKLHTPQRSEWQKSVPGQIKGTLKQRLEESWEHHSHDTRTGT